MAPKKTGKGKKKDTPSTSTAADEVAAPAPKYPELLKVTHVGPVRPLDHLPVEILEHICLLLDAVTLGHLAAASKTLYRIVMLHFDQVWQVVTKRLLPGCSLEDPDPPKAPKRKRSTLPPARVTELEEAKGEEAPLIAATSTETPVNLTGPAPPVRRGRKAKTLPIPPSGDVTMTTGDDTTTTDAVTPVKKATRGRRAPRPSSQQGLTPLNLWQTSPLFPATLSTSVGEDETLGASGRPTRNRRAPVRYTEEIKAAPKRGRATPTSREASSGPDRDDRDADAELPESNDDDEIEDERPRKRARATAAAKGKAKAKAADDDGQADYGEAPEAPKTFAQLKKQRTKELQELEIQRQHSTTAIVAGAQWRPALEAEMPYSLRIMRAIGVTLNCPGCLAIFTTPCSHGLNLDCPSCRSDPWTRRITKSSAMSTYGLNDEAYFHNLNEVTRMNPHYRSAAPMRLFLVYQIIKAVQRHKKGGFVKLVSRKSSRKENQDLRRQEAKERAKFEEANRDKLRTAVTQALQEQRLLEEDITAWPPSASPLSSPGPTWPRLCRPRLSGPATRWPRWPGRPS